MPLFNTSCFHHRRPSLIKTMKESYLPELNEMYLKIAGKLQQDKLGSYEKQIINFLNSNRPRKPGASLQQGQQLPQSHLHPMQQSQQPQSQITSVQPHENQMNPQLQSMNLQGSVATMPQNNVAGLQHNSLSSLSGVPNASQSMINSIQPTSNMDSGQGNAQNALQQAAVGSLQQNPVSAPQQMRQQMAVKSGGFPQHHSVGQRAAYHGQQLKSGAQFPISSPQLLQAASPQMPQHPSPQIDQQNLLTSLTKAGTPLQPASSPFVVPSPATPLTAPSPIPGESEKVNSASPLLAEFTGTDGNHANVSTGVSGKSSVTEQPLERLIKAVQSMSPKALSASVGDIGSVVSMIDRIAGSAPDGNSGTRKMRRYTNAMPLNVVSSGGSANDSFRHLTGSETSDLESTATSKIKRPRLEANHALLEEIREINLRLIDTVVDISNEDVDPTAVVAAAAARAAKELLSSALLVLLLSSPIQPLRLLVPANYPHCSPILLDKFPIEVSKEHEDLSVKAKSKFSTSLRNLSQPMKLEDIARTWDVCARAVISEYAQQSGGGSFSSKYGTWENCLSAA
ncbi:unnamed protein product [Thlaspi arvense]|uniref:ARC105/Med15 mediator subunit C-terminal domain-containing protein n=1 Tax=Thlaspi arvense TaxID=13288 RepID=A0AAU9T881_THLAR|nr:unnamed protein product [Thlaspi arvense]